MGLALISLQGRLAPKPFALGAAGVYLAGIAAQALLSGAAMEHAGVCPFIAVQAVLIWLWLVLHVRRSRDGGEGPSAAIGVALVYVLSLALMLTLVAFFGSADAGGVPSARPADAAAMPLALFLLAVVVSPDFGIFTTILKGLILIAFLPSAIAFIFSIRAGMRGTVR
jgi:hypothetical protein